MAPMRAAALLIVGAGLLAAGCYEAHAGGPRRDGGSVGRDGGAPSGRDAGPVIRRDAGSGPDAGRDCEGVEWIDEAPALRPFDTVRGPSVVGTDGFHVAYWHVSFEVCDGPCPVVVSMSATGPQPPALEVSPMYWADWADTRRVEAHVDPDGQLWFAAIGDARVAWARPPTPGWMAEGEAAFDRPVGDLAFTERGFVWVQTHEATPMGELTRIRLSVFAPFGELVDEIEGDMLTTGFEFRRPRLADAPGEPWIGFTQDVDFPPTVQLARPFAGPEPWFGSSCGVDSFDLAAAGPERVWVVQRCGPIVLVEARDGRGGTDRFELSEGHHPEGAPAIAAYGEGWVIAYWHRDGAVRVAYVDPERGVQPAAVPGSDLGPGETPGALSVASDGEVMAVAWSRTQPSGIDPSVGAVQRFRPCR